MRSVLALLSGVAWSLAGCAAHGAGSAQPGTTVAAAAPLLLAAPATARCEPTAPAAAAMSRWREMTWAEYYMDVEERAWRRGGRVIWVDPPRVDKARRGALASCR